MHVHRCHPRFNQKNMFHRFFKTISLPFCRQPSINSPIKLDETVSPFQSPFRENVYLIFNNLQRRNYQIFKVWFYTCFECCRNHKPTTHQSLRNLLEMFKKPRKLALKKSTGTLWFRFFISQGFRRYFVSNRPWSRK